MDWTEFLGGRFHRQSSLCSHMSSEGFQDTGWLVKDDLFAHGSLQESDVATQGRSFTTLKINFRCWSLVFLCRLQTVIFHMDVLLLYTRNETKRVLIYMETFQGYFQLNSTKIQYFIFCLTSDSQWKCFLCSLCCKYSNIFEYLIWVPAILWVHYRLKLAQTIVWNWNAELGSHVGPPVNNLCSVSQWSQFLSPCF